MPLLQVMVRAGALPPTVPTVPSLSVTFLPSGLTVTVYVQAPLSSAPAQGFAASVAIPIFAPVPSTQVPPTSQLLGQLLIVESLCSVYVMPLLQVMVRAEALPPTVPTVPSLSVIVVPEALSVTVYVQAPPSWAPAHGFAASVTNPISAPVPSTHVPLMSQLLLQAASLLGAVELRKEVSDALVIGSDTFEAFGVAEALSAPGSSDSKASMIAVVLRSFQSSASLARSDRASAAREALSSASSSASRDCDALRALFARATAAASSAAASPAASAASSTTFICDSR